MNTAIRIDCMGTTSSSIDIRGMNPYTLYKQWEYAYEIVENGNEHYEPNNWTVFYTGPYGIDVKTVTISNLLPNSVYKVMLRARRDASSPYDGSDMLVVSTDRDDSAEPLINVTLQNVSDHDATFEAGSWVSLFKNWSYSLAENPSEYDWVEFSTASARRVTFTVSNLEQVTSYKIRVRALSDGALSAYDVSNPIIFSTLVETYPIGLTATTISYDSIKLLIDPYGVTTYTEWKYKIDNNAAVNITLPGGYVPGRAFEITVSGLSANTVYDVIVTAKNSGVTKHSQTIIASTQPVSTPIFKITNTWLTSYMATFNIQCMDSERTLDDYTDWKYSTYKNAAVSDSSKWTSFVPSSDGSFDVNAPSPAEGATRLAADTYYSIRIRATLLNSSNPMPSNIIIFKTNIEPISYDINVVLQLIEPSSMSLSAVSRVEYAVVEYSVKMNPTSADWVVASATKSQYLNDFYYDFTISDLTPNTLYPVQVRCKETPSSEYVYSSILTVTTVKAPVEIYTPPVDAVVHETQVDFIRRPITKAIHIVQYDDRAPIVAVSLYKNGIPFAVPDTSDTRINIRFGKPDHTFSYNPAVGINADRTVVYFVITKQMTVYHGIFNPIVEYLVGSKIAGSGSFEIQIDRNPIQNGDIESSVEYKTVQEYSQEAQHAAEMLQNVSADAESLDQGVPAYATYEPQTGTFHFGLPMGPTGGVESVNGKTGVVEIDSGDIPYDSEETVEEKLQNLEESKANIDGYYENLGAGTADQLVSTTYEEDSVPYSFRTSGGSTDVGDLEYDEIVGGTIAWNQLMQNGNFATATSWQRNRCDLTVVDNIGRFTCNSAEYASWGFYQSPSGIVGHKYLGIGSFRCHTNNEASSLTFQSSGVRMINVIGQTRQNYPINDTWYDLSFIGIFNEVSATASCNLGYASSSDIVANTDYIEAKNVMLFDLTQMFGPDIADYIYSLEAETTGNGIAYFRKLFPNAYYTTDAGTLMSVKAASHKMIGFNVWDEEWELGAMNDFTGANSVSSSNIRSKNYIRVVPNTTYSIECASGHRYYLFYYDADKNYLGRNDANNKGTFLSDGGTYYRTMTSNCHYVRFFYDATSYNNDFCIHLKWSGYRDGEYEAHKERVYPLDSSLELRGIPKLDASNNLYYDGDTYKSNGSVRRRFYEISSTDCTVGTYVAPRWALTYSSPLPAMLSVDTSAVANIKASRYFTTKSKNGLGNGSTSKYEISQADGSGARRRLIFTIDSSIVETQQEAQDWVTNHPFTILFECAEPSDESAAAFTSPQLVDDFGTEEYIDYGVQQGTRDVSVPVGHNTKYLQNLRDKLQHLPNLPDPLEDGDYKIHVSGQQMTLIPDDGGGLYDVSFEGYINLISGDYTWFCSKSNSRILDAIDAGSVVRASVVVDNMPDNTMYLCQYSNLDGLVSFYGMALIPINETNTICYVQLYQSTENSWSSIFTPIQ